MLEIKPDDTVPINAGMWDSIEKLYINSYYVRTQDIAATAAASSDEAK